jgi:hypothetical protein
VTLIGTFSNATESGEAEVAAEPQPTPSAIIFLNDIQRTSAKISGRAKYLPPDFAWCEIGISGSLLKAPNRDTPLALIEGRVSKPDDRYAIVESDLKAGEKAHVLFTSGIKNTNIGLLVGVKRRRNKLIVEIQPRFKLPSGLEDSFNPSGQNRARQPLNVLALQLVAAKAEVLRLKQFCGCRVNQQCELLTAQIREHETWGRQDAAALAEIENYWLFVAKDASIYLRLTSGDATIPVDVAY